MNDEAATPHPRVRTLPRDLVATAEWLVAPPTEARGAAWLWRIVLGSVVVWSIVAALLAHFLTDALAARGDPARSHGAGAPALLFAGLWAVLTPPLAALAVRLPVELPVLRLRNLASLLAMMAGCLLAAGIHLLTYASVAAQLFVSDSVVELPESALMFLGRFHENVAIAAFVIVWHLLLRYREWIRARELRTARLASELTEARLQSLSMELQPHFLFNTLNAISGMVWADQAKADAMVLQLSELLRRSLESSQTPTTSLAEERHVLELYLAIQQVRFGDRLQLTVSIPPELAALDVPRFLLQPLAENAFQHGFAAKPGRVSLHVSASRETRGEQGDDTLVLRLVDDGMGLPADGVIEESTGVGNARRRLQALYGRAQSLELRNREQGGVEVVVTVPARPAQAAPNAP